MEFLRFGSSIPGSYYGCCCADIIQCFDSDPDGKASIELVDGDGGYPLGDKFLGLTHRDVFLQRLRIGTFSNNDMPNHAFFAILTGYQITTTNGRKWLALLKENGFEFLRTVDNSVYTGKGLLGQNGKNRTSSHPNYVFALFRNIGRGSVPNPFTPPEEWTDLPSAVPEAWERLDISEQVGPEGTTEKLAIRQREAQVACWNNLPDQKFYTRQEVADAGVTVTLAGRRSLLPQQSEEARKYVEEKYKGILPASEAEDPFGEEDWDDDFDEDGDY